MSTTDHFPTDTEGLPEATPSETVELADGQEFDLRIAPSPSTVCRAAGARPMQQRGGVCLFGLDGRPRRVWRHDFAGGVVLLGAARESSGHGQAD